jgi:hypothetical protein
MRRRVAFSVLWILASWSEVRADRRPDPPFRARCHVGDQVSVAVFNQRRAAIELLLRIPGERQWWSATPDGIDGKLGDEIGLCPGHYDVKVADLARGTQLFLASGMKLSGMKSFRVTKPGKLVQQRILTEGRKSNDSSLRRIVVHDHGSCEGDGVHFAVTFKNGARIEGDEVLDFAVDKRHPLPASVVATNAKTGVELATTSIAKLGVDVVLDTDCQFEH